jgi:formylglycine-generating enzyme required for sulfatase activity
VIEIPGYTIKREISASATATVLLAEQTSLDREVAIKLLPAALVSDKVQVERFLQIARTLASFSHPNIVAVYDVGLAQDQTPYYSMQFLSGGDFLARAQRGISDPDLTETLASIARALGYVHERGMIHRAVTPQNVLYDAYNTPVLVDFGIAPAPSQDAYATSAGFAVEAGRYMSPEQARGGELSARSDIYSLGALCFYGLTGRPPYDGVDGFAVAYAHVFEPIPRLPPAKAHWQALIDGALAKDPKDRYATTEEFLAALTRIGSERAPAPEPVAAAPAETPVAEAVAAREPASDPPPPAPPAERTPVGATIIAPRAPRPQPRAATAPASPKKTGAMRFWPLAVAALGVVLIAAALLLPKRTPTPQTGEPAKVTTTAPTPDSTQPATPTEPPPAAADAGAPPSDSLASADGAANAPASNDGTEAPPAGELGSIDAAEAQAEADLMDPAKAPTVVDPLSEAIRLGRIDLAGQRLTSPPGTNALERFQFALKLEPKSRSARQGIVDVAKKYVELADKNPPDKAGGAGALSAYVQQLQRAEDVARLVPEGADVLRETAARRRKAAEPLLAQAKAAADAWDKEAAKADYEQALQIDPESSAARDGLKFVATIGEPGFVFREKIGNAAAPPMVVLPGASVALARHPVTRAEFRRFWDAAGRAQFSGKEFSCRDRESIFRSSKKRGWEDADITQGDDHPVVCVTWPQAAAYAQWLAKQTGKRYRLPSPNEFDAVASRAGRGDCATANLADAAYNKQFESRDGAACDDGFAATAPVERFAAIEGIYDIDGNVREWVAACGNGTPAAAAGSCRDFMVKGRGWLSSAAKEAATASDNYSADVGLNTVGFRVARDMGK